MQQIRATIAPAKPTLLMPTRNLLDEIIRLQLPHDVLTPLRNTSGNRRTSLAKLRYPSPSVIHVKGFPVGGFTGPRRFVQRRISVDWLATHCHTPFWLTHVSVKRPRRMKALPFSIPLSRYIPVTTAAFPYT